MDSFALKLLALACMIIDHVSKSGLLKPGGIFPQALYYMDFIGRIAFPIYAYLVAEGCGRTRSMSRFVIRLALFAVISEPFFRLALQSGNYAPTSLSGFDYFAVAIPACLKSFKIHNVFMTIFLGTSSVLVYQKAETVGGGKIGCIIFFSVAALIAQYCASDYGAMGVLLIFSLYLAENKKRRLTVLFIWCGCFYLVRTGLISGISTLHQSRTWIRYFCACLSIIPLLLYNGQRGKNFKWSFYWAYPLHLLIIILVREF